MCRKYSPRVTIWTETRWVFGDDLEKFQWLDPVHPEEVLGAISGWKEPEIHYRPGWALTGHQQEAARSAHSSNYSGSFITHLFKVAIFFSPSNPFSRSPLAHGNFLIIQILRCPDKVLLFGVMLNPEWMQKRVSRSSRLTLLRSEHFFIKLCCSLPSLLWSICP